MRITNNDMIKEIRQTAKNVGLTFKVDNHLTINGSTAYKFINRQNGEKVLTDCTLNSSYQNAMSGYIESWNGEEFKSTDQY